jgi:hypothetical protein
MPDDHSACNNCTDEDSAEAPAGKGCGARTLRTMCKTRERERVQRAVLSID